MYLLFLPVISRLNFGENLFPSGTKWIQALYFLKACRMNFPWMWSNISCGLALIQLNVPDPPTSSYEDVHIHIYIYEYDQNEWQEATQNGRLQHSADIMIPNCICLFHSIIHICKHHNDWLSEGNFCREGGWSLEAWALPLHVLYLLVKFDQDHSRLLMHSMCFIPGIMTRRGLLWM